MAKIFDGVWVRARRVPRWQASDWLVRLLARRNPALREVVPQLGKVRNATAEKVRRMLDRQSRTSGEAVAATGESLLQLGLAALH